MRRIGSTMKIPWSISALGISLCFSIFIQSGTSIATETQKMRDIRTLFDLLAASQFGFQIMLGLESILTNQVQKSQPVLSDTIARVIHEETQTLVNRSLKNQSSFATAIYSIVDRNYSHAEIQSLIAFLRAPSPNNTIAIKPVVLQEAMAVGRVWGQSAMPAVYEKIRLRLQAYGITIPAYR